MLALYEYIASYADACIETQRCTLMSLVWVSHPMRMRVLKLAFIALLFSNRIASYSGACIETTTVRWKGMTPSIASYSDACIEIRP